MTVRVLFFASLKDSVGTDEITLEVDGPSTLEDLLNALQGQISEAGRAALTAENVRIAVNHTLCSAPVVIQTGDEVAFMPPVTGG